MLDRSKYTANAKDGNNVNTSLIEKVTKLYKWTKSFFRIIKYKIIYRSRLQCKLFCNPPIYIGKHCKIRIGRSDVINISPGVYLDDYCCLETLGGKIKISKSVYFNTFSRVVSKSNIEIGENSMFGTNVSIYDHDHDISEGVLFSRKKFVLAPVIIKNEVWCGTNVVIIKGSVIGSNCTVGANSLVKGTLESNSVYVGNPVKKIRDCDKRK
ncbi:acyltransferase [Gorillibacterium sp. sgz500922]|uniref:acyltransferase n=1 Tax=Gorillibacterium sp. sgz500922 TaxID=3446694 RepID=UPI003F677C66